MTERYNDRTSDMIAPWKHNLNDVQKRHYNEFTLAMLTLKDESVDMRLSKVERAALDHVLELFFP